MSLTVIAVGKMRAGPEADLCARYVARIRPRLQIVELPDGRGSPAEIKRREGEAMAALLPDGAFVVALTPDGAVQGSEAFARDVQQWLDLGRRVYFLIGGAEGLAPAMLARADTRLSFGPMVWPHMLARVMLCEQVFRARAIAAGHPYHRG